MMVTSIQAEPSRITVQGPESRLTPLVEIETSPLSIEGATGSVEAVVTPVLTDPLLRVLTGSPVIVNCAKVTW